MAYASVASLLQTVDILLNHHQSSISPQFKTQIISIHQHTCSLQSFIEEGSSERVNNWEETIREVANKAEDIIELLLSDSLLKSSVESSRSELEKGKGKYEEARYSLDELEKVAKEIESIVNRVKGGRRIKTADGSDEELMEIVNRLVGVSSSLEMIAICGSGGMGKTTLATNACSHPLIMKHFDVCASTTVTREHIQVDVIEELLRSMGAAEKSILNSEYGLINRLLRSLGNRRYLIVVDDLRSFEVLERLKMMLPDYGNGSRILFTTRSSDLAKSAHHIHEMSLLDEDQTWNMFREKIFEGDPCPFQLESVGKTIARSCGGHQLSIAAVSGILVASDQTQAVWEDVSENIKIATEEDGDKIYEILYLSYMYLPHHLRPCLLYLGVFPEGHVMYVSTLVRLWIAEGFVSESGYRSLEQTGEEYVEDLVRRSLASINRRKCNGRIKSIRVHDLIRGMCLRQAHIDNFNVHLDRDTPGLEIKEIIKSCRRLSSSDHCDDFLRGVYGSTIRTLFFSSEYGKLDLTSWIGLIRLIRILNLLDVHSYPLAGEVFELFHLRYLAFRSIYNISEAISNLENLQTLIICHVKKDGIFDKLPEGIWRMPQLRHLRIFSFKFPNKKGPTPATLESLQMISRVVDFVCSRESLKMTPNLKYLDLLYTKKSRDVLEDYELHNLTCLHRLEVLKIETNLAIGKEPKLSRATFPLTLKKLSLRGLQLSREDMKNVASLPNLEVLKLRNYACAGETWNTSEGGFSRLFFLRIEKSNLTHWNTKSSHFPRLAWLVLVRCWNLLEVPYEMAEVPTLQLIELGEVSRSLRRSAERIQQDRHSLGHYPLDVDFV